MKALDVYIRSSFGKLLTSLSRLELINWKLNPQRSYRKGFALKGLHQHKANNAKDQTVASIYDNCFCIPLGFEILETSLPLYQYGLGSHLTYDLTFADYSDVIKSTDLDATYTISNISLHDRILVPILVLGSLL